MKLFENLPSTKTPINAENLNQLQDNLVVVSATEPTGDNREKVWIQKGNNLFDKNNCLTYAWVGENGTIINSNDNNVLSALIPCKPNTKYTLSGFTPNAYLIVVGFDSSKNYTWTISNQLEKETIKTITTGANDHFIKIGFGYAVPNLSTLMINQGDVALPNEEYITPKIYVKNNNDIYEEFYKKPKNRTGFIDNKLSGVVFTKEKIIQKDNIVFMELILDCSNIDLSQQVIIGKLKNVDLPIGWGFYSCMLSYNAYGGTDTGRLAIDNGTGDIYIHDENNTGRKQVFINFTYITD